MSRFAAAARWLLARLLVEAALRVRPEVRIRDVRVRTGPHLSGPVLMSLYRGRYERRELACLSQALRPGDVVMELGAGLGVLATYCAQRVGSGRVFTYEANPALEPHIRETFRLNGVSPSLTMAFVGARPGRRDFWVDKDFWRSSTTRLSEAATRIQVPVLPIDEELARVDPTVLVMDVEGAEGELLPAMDFRRVRTLVLEVHPRVLRAEGTAAVQAALRAAGFVIGTGPSTEDVWLLERWA